MGALTREDICRIYGLRSEINELLNHEPDDIDIFWGRVDQKLTWRQISYVVGMSESGAFYRFRRMMKRIREELFGGADDRDIGYTSDETAT